MSIIRKSIAILVLMTNATSAWAESTTTCDSGGVDLGFAHYEHSSCTTKDNDGGGNGGGGGHEKP